MEFGPFSAEFGVVDVVAAISHVFLWGMQHLKARLIVGGYDMPEGLP